MKKHIFAIVAVILSVCFVFCACQNGKVPENETEGQAALLTEVSTLGTGSKTFYFRVCDENGHITPYVIKTDKNIVGEALQELNLISGEEGDYGLYVKEVNGIKADYETTGTYWAFYIGEQMAPQGIDLTEIVEFETYIMKVEK